MPLHCSTVTGLRLRALDRTLVIIIAGLTFRGMFSGAQGFGLHPCYTVKGLGFRGMFSLRVQYWGTVAALGQRAAGGPSKPFAPNPKPVPSV